MRTAWMVFAMLAVSFAASDIEALANGDPASHVLRAREVFIPFDPSLCSPAGRRLDALTERTRRAGYPIKVAVIPTAEDLGTLYRLFGRPEVYARQLASELPPELFKAPQERRRYRLLVLMPGGTGLNKADSEEGRALKRVSVDPESTKEELAGLAIKLVSRLSRATGHRVAMPPPKPACPDIDIGSPASGSHPDSGSGLGTVAIVVAPIAMLALALYLGSRGRSRNAQE
jgi:hypothetical protein